MNITPKMSGVVNNLLSTLHLSSSTPKDPPKEPDPQDLAELQQKYAAAKQDHVFHYYPTLSVAEKAALVDQLSKIDPNHVNDITEKALHPSPSSSSDEKPTLAPLPDAASASVLDSSADDLAAWTAHGHDLIAQNKVGVVLMAGGQGTRLGSAAPKGCYNIGLPSSKSLFQLQGERILRVQQLSAAKHGKEAEDVVVPWYVMTSGPTREPTQRFFREQGFFGLREQDVIIFEQGILPCIDNDGKILMEDKSKVAVAPDGNGGLYQAMFLSSVISDMRKRGIEHVHAYCVDNCLVKVADPLFMGFAASKLVSIATKAVRKRDAKESVGLILSKNGKPDVVEYSEISAETAEEKDLKNPKILKFRAANIVNHYYSFAFLESIPTWAHKLPHHVARKKIPHIDMDKDKVVKPEKPNGVKLEQFVFDCFPFLAMDKFACLEVRREDEFSPLKNASGTGEDDPETSRSHILEQGKRWVEAAGGVVVSEGDQTGVEVSPLISYGGEGLEFLSQKQIKAPAVLEREGK